MITRIAVRLSRCLIHLHSMQELRGGSQCGIIGRRACTPSARKKLHKDPKLKTLRRLKVAEHNMPSTDGIRSLMTCSTASDNRVRGRSYLHNKRSLKHLHRGRNAVLGGHAATNRLGSPRGPIEHALKQCVPVLMYDGDIMQMMETQGVMFVNVQQLCFFAAAAAAALHPPWQMFRPYIILFVGDAPKPGLFARAQTHTHSLSLSLSFSSTDTSQMV